MSERREGVSEGMRGEDGRDGREGGEEPILEGILWKGERRGTC